MPRAAEIPSIAIGVCISPGRMALTRMPWRASPIARCWVSAFTPGLGDLVGGGVGRADRRDRRDVDDRAVPCSRITGMTALHVRHIADRLTSKIRCHASSSTWSPAASPAPMPTLLCRTSSAPNARRVTAGIGAHDVAIGDVRDVRDGLAALVADHRDGVLGRHQHPVDDDDPAPSRA